jgi:hypothetical protein
MLLLILNIFVILFIYFQNGTSVSSGTETFYFNEQIGIATRTVFTRSRLSIDHSDSPVDAMEGAPNPTQRPPPSSSVSFVIARRGDEIGSNVAHPDESVGIVVAAVTVDEAAKCGGDGRTTMCKSFANAVPVSISYSWRRHCRHVGTRCLETKFLNVSIYIYIYI